MSNPPELTDRAVLCHRRRRAEAQGLADVLHRQAADELQERLEEVNRPLKEAATVSGFPDLWRSLRPEDRHLADEETLDLAPGTQDLVIHALALHWANDPVGQLIQCRRALRPDGLFLGVLFGGGTLQELRVSLAEAEIQCLGGLSPRVAPMGEVRALGGLLQRAGFALPVVDSLPLTLSYRDAWHLMSDLRAMGETNVLTTRHRKPSPRGLFAHAAAHYQNHFALTEGRVRATFELVFLTGWAPAESQPKPLRPGSAQMRLAEALGTEESPLPGPDPKAPLD